MLVLLDRYTYWQAGCVIPKGGYQHVNATGLEAWRQAVGELIPWAQDQLEQVADWKDISVLSVGADRLVQWYMPGLLLIGDAAHIMSPVGGVGINYAIQDAVVAANELAQPLKAGTLQLDHLALFSVNAHGQRGPSKPFKPKSSAALLHPRSIPIRPFGCPSRYASSHVFRCCGICPLV